MSKPDPIQEILAKHIHSTKNGFDITDAVPAIRRYVEVEKEKLLVMNLSDASFAAGQMKGLLGKEDPYWERRVETLNMHVAAQRSRLYGEEGQSRDR